MESGVEKHNEPRSPSPKSYIHAYQYFNDYFNYRRSLNPQFSFELWSAELGFKSRSYLRMICQGQRNVTPALIDIFAQKQKISNAEIEHLKLIAFYYKAQSLSEKKLYLDKIYESLEHADDQMEVKDYARFLSNRQLPILQLLLSFSDMKATESKLMEVLGGSRSQLQKNLQVLENMKLIRPVYRESAQDKIWMSCARFFNVSDKSKDEALKLFHYDTFHEMREALQKNPVMRRFRSIYFAMSEEKFVDFIDETENFLKKMQNKFGSEQLEDKYIFKLNLNSYPTTKKYKK